MEDRMGSVFNVQGANEFNNFISNLGLVEVQLEGYSFTLSHPSATKMSKLDRFLVTEGLVSLFPHISGICLDRHLSDHRPILLREVITDYGATPFRMYHSWFSLHSFEQMVMHTWNSIVLDDRNWMVHSKKKMHFLKKEIRVWVMDQKQKQSGRIKEIKSKLSDIDKLLDQGGVNIEILLSRMDLLKQMQDIKSSDAHDCMHKAKIQWAIEGDENSMFFHGIINRKHANLAIKGVIVDDLCVAVEWFFDHSSFTKGCNSSFIALISKTHDPKFVSDYRPISLIGSLYKVVTKILAIRLSMVIFDLISDVQTAFLPNREILDGLFIINELLSWCKHKKQQAMVFRVDFAKAYDSIRWDYLDDVVRSFGFGSKWCSWIGGSLISGMTSILINGSPTSEFQFNCGLKQGDPLAPYLFILIMESLYFSFSRAVDAGIFTGIKIDSSLTISHLFYAYDAVFISEWYNANLTSITHILHCFSLLSSLKINLKKSHLLGVGTSNDTITATALNLGCSVMKTPFKYLGMVGGNSSTIKSRDDTIGKLKARLSNWKLKTLSIGGRLMLLKLVLGSTPIYNMSLYKVPKSVLHSMESIRRNFFNGI
nr:RNA-directed DNA polymerase, eukaryota [Tanacetum cinerariifolium]